MNHSNIKRKILLITGWFFIAILFSRQLSAQGYNVNYITNRLPLAKSAYIHLPSGTVKPEGWLKRQLQIQADGLTGHVYSEFEAEYWSITNYHEGIVALAFVLDDARLKGMAKRYVDEFLADKIKSFNARDRKNSLNDNYSVQHGLRFLTEYYESTRDQRIIEWLTRYFMFNKDTIPSSHFGYCCTEGSRIGENIAALYWLYNRTGDTTLLRIAGNFKNNVDFITRGFLNFPEAFPNRHGVDISQEIKYPAFFYQQFHEMRYKNAVFTGLESIDRYYGQVGGRFSCHELIPEDKSRGLEPSNGTELCSVMELAYSMERIFEIFGDVTIADRLENIVYNSIPGSMTPDMWAHQYDQQANQVLVDVQKRVFDNNPSANIYGITPHFPCCLSNMHQGWPRFVENMWMATNDNGLIAVAYGPNSVTAMVGKGRKVTIRQQTDYPFKGSIRFIIESRKPVKFPLHFRIPTWAKGTRIIINKKIYELEEGTIKVINRKWKKSDEIGLIFPMQVRTEKRFNNAISVLRGPVYFSLKIGQEYKQLGSVNEWDSAALVNAARLKLPVHNWEIRPTTEWNYGILMDGSVIENIFSVTENELNEFPFSQKGEQVFIRNGQKWEKVIWEKPEPVIIKVKGALVKDWDMKNGSADNPPENPVMKQGTIKELELIPYGCTRLRISEFPVISAK